MNEERVRILRMVSEGKLTPEQAEELLAALNGAQSATTAEATRTSTRPRWLRVRVTNTQTGHVRVNVSVPFKLVEVGSRVGARWMPAEFGEVISELLEAVASGEENKIVEVTDEEAHEHVVIYVE
ncbi:MAG: hypothetical protein Q9O62_08975 [Ardenticatenia bacterium]|nr:hypothetical protein [Ardenticatenia bacterium]